MAKKLKIWNGRGAGRGNELDGHLFVCATSRQHAVDLLRQAGHVLMTLGELDTYYSKGCWGNSMNGITPEIGVWICRHTGGGHNNGKPERLV